MNSYGTRPIQRDLRLPLFGKSRQITSREWLARRSRIFERPYR
jgi:hypothetical protein